MAKGIFLIAFAHFFDAREPRVGVFFFAKAFVVCAKGQGGDEFTAVAHTLGSGKTVRELPDSQK